MKIFNRIDTLLRTFALWYAACSLETIRIYGRLPQIMMAKVPKLIMACLALGIYMCISLHINPLQPQARDFDKATCWIALPVAESQYQISNFVRESEGLPLASGMTIPSVCQPFLAKNKGTQSSTSTGETITVSSNTILLD